LVDSFAVLSFSKNFNFSKTFLGGLARIGEEILVTSACLSLNNSALLTGLLMLLFRVNLDDIFYLNILLSSVLRESYPVL